LNPSEFEDSYEDREEIRGAILTETIKSLHPAAPLACKPSTTVLDAVHMMNDRHVGCVCVVENDRLVGIFTERDVLRKVVEHALDTKRTPVSELMTKSPETLTVDDKIAFALNKMHVGGYRHIPIVDRAGKLTGIISIRDIAEFVCEMFPDGVLNVPPEPRLGISTRPDGG
jgi:CBS domain-containing protein